ncbi:MAG: potassium transporter TrkG, partial [Patescibacteria group bacterium]
DNLMGFQSDWLFLTPIMAAVIAGGIGYPVYRDLWTQRGWKRISLHGRLTLYGYAFLLVAGALLFIVLEWRNPETMGAMEPHAHILNGIFQSATARTAGFNAVNIGEMSDQSLMLTSILMFIGGGSAGTAGGVKVATVGVISGLARSITAGGAGVSEELTNIIQTDAAINPGNSGGPLLNIAGQVIGINTAVAQGAQGIGFAIPINEVKNSIETIKQTGKIVRPWLGVRYVMLTEDIATQNNLTVIEGALIIRGEQRTDLAVIPGSPADKAGLAENDIILEINGVKLTSKNILAKEVGKYKSGEEITLKVWHKGDTQDVKVKLGE